MPHTGIAHLPLHSGDTYNRSIEALRRAVQRAKLGHRDKLAALRRLGAGAI